MPPLTVLNLVLLLIPGCLAYPQPRIDAMLSDMRSGFAWIASLRSLPSDPPANKRVVYKAPKGPPPYEKPRPKDIFRTKVRNKGLNPSTSKRRHPLAVLDMLFGGDDIPLKPALNTKTFPSDFETFSPFETTARTVGYYKKQSSPCSASYNGILKETDQCPH